MLARVADDEDVRMIGLDQALGHALDIGLGDGTHLVAIRFVVVRILGVTAGEFIHGEGASDLAFGGEVAREAIDEAAFGNFMTVDWARVTQ